MRTSFRSNDVQLVIKLPAYSLYVDKSRAACEKRSTRVKADEKARQGRVSPTC